MSYDNFRISFLMFYLLLLYITHTIYTVNACTSNIPRVTNLPVSKDGTVKILTTVQDTIKIPSTWCVDLADKIEINGTSAILENVQRIEIKLSAVTATHVSGVTGASLVNLPDDTKHCGDSRESFCVLTQEVCGDHTYPEFYNEPLKTGYKDAKTEYWGNKCGCSGGINCYGNYHQTTRVFMPPNNFVRAWVMSNSFNYQFEIDTGGLLYNSNTSSRWISYGTEGITHLSNDAGFEVIIVLADQMTGKFPERAVFIQDSGQTGPVKYVPFSWGTQGTLGCLDPSIPGWSSAAAYSFEQAKEEATGCFRNQMKNIGWSFWLSSQREGTNRYVTNDISAAGPISERINLIKSSRFVGTDKLTAVHTLGNIVVDIFIRFPERKVIAYQDTGRCRLKSCSKTISDTVSSVTLNCVCAQSTPGILKVNSTDLNTNAYSETSISLGMLDDKFELPLALNATSKILICTVYNCVNAEITWVVDDTSLRRSNLTNKPNPLAPDHSNSGGKFSAGSWFSDVFSFRSLLSLISCISSGDISCIVGSLFGSIINILMLIGICILLKKAYRHYAASNNNKSNVVRIVSETKKHNDEVELTPNPAVTTAETKA